MEQSIRQNNLEYRKILKSFKRKNIFLSCLLSKIFEKFIKSAEKSQSIKEAVLIPYYLAKSLKNSDEKILEKALELAYGNIWGWIAWTLIDKMAEKEKVDFHEVLAGTTALCKWYSIYSNILSPYGAESILQEKYLEGINAMNEEYESKFREKPIKYKKDKLLEYQIKKSTALEITVLATFIISGYKVTDPKLKKAKEMIHHFISAKQLSDDACDWREDLGSNADTMVTELLREKLEDIFDKDVSIKVADKIEYHLAETRKLADEILDYPTEFTHILERYKTS